MKQYVFVLFLLLASTVCAQQEDGRLRDIYQQAEEAYSIGRFDSSIHLLDTHLNEFQGTLKVSAYRLLSLCYLSQDKTESAEQYANLLLKEDPYYRVTIYDPLRFSDMIERLKRGESATITTASQQAESIEEAPVPVTLITEDMIKASGARNLRELLMIFVPGITPIEGEECNMSMRGIYSYSQENILIMRDGHRLNNYSTNSIAPDYRINIDNIKQIEVLRGAASSLYGNVALTAVVNIITKSGNDVDGVEVSYGMGDNHTYKGSVLLGKRFMNTDLTIGASVYSSKGDRINIDKNSQDFYGIIPKDGYIYVDGYNHKPAYDFGLKYQWNNFRLSAGHQYGKRTHTYNSLYVLSTYDYDKYQSINGVKPGRGTSTTYADLKYTGTIKNTNVEASFFVDYESTNLYNVLGDTIPEGFENLGESYFPSNEYLKDSIYVTNGAFELQNWKSLTMGAELKILRNYKLKEMKGNFILGTQFLHFNSFYNDMSLGDMYDRIIMTTVNDRTGIYENEKENSFSVYGQIKHYFSPNLIFNGGLRYDYKKRFNNKNLNVVSPRLALIYIPSQSCNMKLSYAHSYVDAPFFYRASKIMYLGNEDLNSQSMDNFQFSVTAKIKPLNLTYDGNIFYNRSRDIIMMLSTGYSNVGSLEMIGWENILQYKDPHFVAYFNATYQRLLSSENYATYTNNVAGVPDFFCNLNLEKELYPWVKNLWIGANISAKTKQTGKNSENFVFKGNYDTDVQQGSYKINGTCLFDLGLRYSLKSISLNLRCYNLFNTRYRLGGDRMPVLQAGRSILATIRVNM